MPYTAPTVNYSATYNGTYTTLTGVQSVSIRRGRQRFQDSVSQSVCTIELIPANSYAIPLAIGQYVDVRDANSSSSPCYFSGRITDISRRYDMPYDAGTGAAPGDRITITVAGGVGFIGTGSIDNLSVFSFYDAAYVCELIALSVDVFATSSNSGVFTQTQTLLGPAMNYLNEYLQTGQLFIDDVDAARLAEKTWVYIYKNKADNSAGLAYSDTAQTRFTALEYQSSAQNTFNFVSVEANGLTPQIKKAASGPYNALQYLTYNTTTTDALSLANYLYNLLSGQLAPVPFTMTTNTFVAPACMDAVKMTSTTALKPIIGQTATITFRGSTVNAQVLGFDANFYVDHGRVQLYFAPSLGIPFTLNSSIAGVLNTNRLGYP